MEVLHTGLVGQPAVEDDGVIVAAGRRAQFQHDVALQQITGVDLV